MIVKIRIKARRKIESAILSYLKLSFSFELRIDRKEKKLHVIRSMDATPVHSSMSVSSLNREIFRDVKTIRQNPNRFDEVFKICGDLLSVMVIH